MRVTERLQMLGVKCERLNKLLTSLLGEKERTKKEICSQGTQRSNLSLQFDDFVEKMVFRDIFLLISLKFAHKFLSCLFFCCI